MVIEELWRFPVKSLGGERLDAVDVSDLGLDGDRRWGLLDRETGTTLTAKRDGRLLFASARLVGSAGVVVTLPDGTETDRSADLSAWLDRDVLLEPAGEEGGRYENPLDYERESDWVTWQGPPDALHDAPWARVSLVTTGDLGPWDRRRFRSNVVLRGSGERTLAGREVRLGTCRLQVVKPITRCVMVTRAQPGVERDLDVLRRIDAERDRCLAVGALVARPGRIAVGDALSVT
jgi:uncharacterized protein YcbX